MSEHLRGSILTLGRRAAATSQRAAHDVLFEECQDVVETAKAKWPRDSGQSAALLKVHDGGSFVAVIGGAEYTLRIVSNGVRPWFDYIELPLEYRLERVSTQFGDRLLAELERGA